MSRCNLIVLRIHTNASELQCAHLTWWTKLLPPLMTNNPKPCAITGVRGHQLVRGHTTYGNTRAICQAWAVKWFMEGRERVRHHRRRPRSSAFWRLGCFSHPQRSQVKHTDLVSSLQNRVGQEQQTESRRQNLWQCLPVVLYPKYLIIAYWLFGAEVVTAPSFSPPVLSSILLWVQVLAYQGNGLKHAAMLG